MTMTEQVETQKQQEEQTDQKGEDIHLVSNSRLQHVSQEENSPKGFKSLINKMKGLSPQTSKRCIGIVTVNAVILLIIYLICKPKVQQDRAFHCHLHPQYEQHIYKNLEYFSTGITQAMIDKPKEFKRKKVSIKIKDGVMSYGYVNQQYLYRYWLDFLRQTAKVLPDSQLTISFVDEPRVLKHGCKNTKDWAKCSCDKDYDIPWNHSFFIKPCQFDPVTEKIALFSFGVIPQCFADLLFPSYFHFPVWKVEDRVEWKQKTFKALWRGSATGIPLDYYHCWPIPWLQGVDIDMDRFNRPRLLNLCRKISDCDAQFTQISLCKPDNCQKIERKFGKASTMGLGEQIKSKILIDIDGYTYSQRYPWVMSSGSAVMKIHSFKDIGSVLGRPWIHYIPAKIDLSDFEENLQWAKNNDEEVRKIAGRAFQLSKVFSEEQYKCYIFKLVSLYAQLFVSDEQYQINERRKQIQQEKDQEVSKMCNLDEAFENQIEKDFAPFRMGIPPSMVERAKQQEGIRVIRIYQHKVETGGQGMSDERRHFFQDIASYLPDMEFVVNTDSQPRVLKYSCLEGGKRAEFFCDVGYERPEHGFFTKPCRWNPVTEVLPIFSTSKIPECFVDILFPTGTAPDSQTSTRWKNKEFGSVWRGTSEGGNFGGSQCQKKHNSAKEVPFQTFHRQRLVQLCSTTRYCDAKFTGYTQCADPVCSQMRAKYGKEVDKQLIKEQAHHKILIDIDGKGHSQEFTDKMASGSAVLKITAFLDFPLIVAQPWVHFVPVRVDLQDFEKQLQWVKQNDRELEQIALRGKELVSKKLNYASQKCYAIKVLRKYSRLLIPEARYQARLKIRETDSSYLP